MWNPPAIPWPVALYCQRRLRHLLSGDRGNRCAQRPASRGTLGLAAVPQPGELVVQRRHPLAGADGRKLPDQSQRDQRGRSGRLRAPKTVSVDNDPVGVSFRTPNDANPSVWVNHAVTVDATPTRRPLRGRWDELQRRTAQRQVYPASGLTVDGDGVHTVSCTAWNNAVGPRASRTPGRASMAVHIDEAPPSVELRAAEPGRSDRPGRRHERQRIGRRGRIDRDGPRRHERLDDLATSFDGRICSPTSTTPACTAPTTSGRPHATTWATAPRPASGWRYRCGSPPIPQVSLTKIVNPLRTSDRARAGARRLALGDRPPRPQAGAGQARRPPQDGQGRQVRRAMHDQARPDRTARLASAAICAPAGPCDQDAARPVRPQSHAPRALHDRQGVPLAGQPVRILAAPNNDSGAFSQVAVVTAAPNGSWTATLPPGPSRIIRAVTDGTATILPSSGQVTTIVPAK